MAQGHPVNTLPPTVRAVASCGCVCAVASSVAAGIARGHPVAAARHGSGNAFTAGVSQSDRLSWKAASGLPPVGTGLARVVTLVERKTGLLRMRLAPNGGADTVMRAIVHALHPLRARVNTLTWDNGSEFAEHALIDIVLDARSYFADPYSSWQRETNENTNGLIRQYLPKRYALSNYSEDEIQTIEDKINQRPRKRLDFHTE